MVGGQGSTDGLRHEAASGRENFLQLRMGTTCQRKRVHRLTRYIEYLKNTGKTATVRTKELGDAAELLAESR